jgi:hypothetical protein
MHHGVQRSLKVHRSIGRYDDTAQGAAGLTHEVKSLQSRYGDGRFAREITRSLGVLNRGDTEAEARPLSMEPSTQPAPSLIRVRINGIQMRLATLARGGPYFPGVQ